nr:hypothetical protein [Xenococcaceae cyanobacterium MO_234.B1]
DREGNKLVRVIRITNQDGVKQRPWQESWNGTKWVRKTKHLDRADIPIYVVPRRGEIACGSKNISNLKKKNYGFQSRYGLSFD